MSQPPGGVEAINRSASPGTLKRKRDTPNFSYSRPSDGNLTKTAKLAKGGANSPSLLHSHTNATSQRAEQATAGAHGPSAKLYRSPDSDEMHQSDSGDTLQGVGSASSLASTASSVFSSNSQAFAHNRKASLANGLTPMTSHSDSSPPKTSSPHASKAAAEMASIDGAHVASVDITPAPTPAHKTRPQMLPPPRTARGYRAVWDPEMDNKLSKEERKRAIVRKREFGTEVRSEFHSLLSLHNMIPAR